MRGIDTSPRRKYIYEVFFFMIRKPPRSTHPNLIYLLDKLSEKESAMGRCFFVLSGLTPPPLPNPILFWCCLPLTLIVEHVKVTHFKSVFDSWFKSTYLKDLADKGVHPPPPHCKQRVHFFIRVVPLRSKLEHKISQFVPCRDPMKLN